MKVPVNPQPNPPPLCIGPVSRPDPLTRPPRQALFSFLSSLCSRRKLLEASMVSLRHKTRGCQSSSGHSHRAFHCSYFAHVNSRTEGGALILTREKASEGQKTGSSGPPLFLSGGAVGSVCLLSRLTVGRSPGSNTTLLCMWLQSPPGVKGQVKYRRVGGERERDEVGSEKLDLHTEISRLKWSNRTKAELYLYFQNSTFIRLKKPNPHGTTRKQISNHRK